MKSKKSLWTSITGGVTSAAPILLSCCKSGACIGVCANPVASLFGISSAAMTNSPWIAALEPILIAVSAVSFTISYYSLYVLPKLACATPDGCACEPSAKEKRRTKINKAVFWFGLILSIGFLSYFEYNKYQANVAASECSPAGCSEPSSEECCAGGDSTACAATESGNSAACDSLSDCCTSEKNNVIRKPMEMTCKLTSPELRKRKETVLADLRKMVIETKELTNGYSFKFEASDAIFDQLNEFVKTERQCCDFFTFKISTSGKETWLELTGADGAKDFIKTELELVK